MQGCHLSHPLEHSNSVFCSNYSSPGIPHYPWFMKSCPSLRSSIIPPPAHGSSAAHSYPLDNSLWTNFPGSGQRQIRLGLCFPPRYGRQLWGQLSDSAAAMTIPTAPVTWEAGVTAAGSYFSTSQGCVPSAQLLNVSTQGRVLTPSLAL